MFSGPFSPLLLPAMVVCALDSRPHHVFSDDYQRHDIHFQETKIKDPTGFRGKVVIEGERTPRGDTGKEPRRGCEAVPKEPQTCILYKGLS